MSESITLQEHLRKASHAQKNKYTSEDFKKWGKLSVEKRTSGMTKEEKSEYFKNIRKGKKVSR